MLARVLAPLLGLFLMIAAQTVKADPTVMGLMLRCESKPGDMFKMVQEKYGEIPFSSSTGIIQDVQGRWLQANIYMFINPTTFSYSIIAVDPVSETQCMLLAGKEFKPIGSPFIDGDKL